MLVLDTRTPPADGTGGSLDRPKPTPRPRAQYPPTDPRPPRRRPPLPASAAELPLDQAAAIEAMAILAPLVPGSAGLPLVRLAQLVAAKLDGHGTQCAAALNPARGSLTVDEVRTRCRALFDALTAAERPAALTLVTLDVQETLR